MGGEIVYSLWLPVGRENFFSPMTDPALIVPDRRVQTPTGTVQGVCRTDRVGHLPGYIPHLRESVMRRLIEVLPVSFGYDWEGTCEFCDEPDETNRPVSLTMVLDLARAEPGLRNARAINAGLRSAGVTRVTMRVDENGFYTFAAVTADGANREEVQRRLREHIVTVFGDGFRVDRLSTSKGRHGYVGANAVREYNGLNPLGGGAQAPRTYEAETPTLDGVPLGALSFYQLNIMIEALCNQSLLPGVFFEQYDAARRWLEANRGKVSVITDLDLFLDEIIRPVDARSVEGQTAALRRFLVISRGTLQWLRRSVDSVRRSLLDQMMAVSHRRARLIQLDLSGISYERTPELTGEATESQMRGYVVLISTKLPLIQSVGECALAAVAALTRSASGQAEGSVGDLQRLATHWDQLLAALRAGVHTLTEAVSQDWQERLLYEQEQARSEQEALAEIERSRRGLPDRRRAGDLIYNALMLILTAIAVVVAIPIVNNPNVEISQRLMQLVPLTASIVAILLALAITTWARRFSRQRQPNNEAYGYEFAFRLDEASTAPRIHNRLTVRPTVTLQPAQMQRRLPAGRTWPFGRTVLRPLGGWRTKKISEDTELVKVHSVAVVKLRAFRYARFEIVLEILIRRISGQPEHFLRHCRVFGDSPRPIPLPDLHTLVHELVREACGPMAADGELDKLVEITSLTDGIYLGDTAGRAPQTRQPLDDRPALAGQPTGSR